MLQIISAINIAAVETSPREGWISIKYGSYPNPVGTQIFDRLSGQKIASRFNADSNRPPSGLPIYVGHPDDPAWSRQHPGATCAAVGRVKEVVATNEGVRLRYVLNEDGAVIAPRFSGYSPHWGMMRLPDRNISAYRPVVLFSIGLTNSPNIPGTLFTNGANSRDRIGMIAAAVNDHRKAKALDHDAAFKSLRTARPELFL